ncbi:MAG TPA: DUF3592 domain-containing protein [Thermoanaerobaculia bacterium]|jgi:hypothetical protein|nr:DUF3592 domain-containing protein [Thermoanaerobaculia bacterium]
MDQLENPPVPLVFVPSGTPRQVGFKTYAGPMAFFGFIFGGLFGGVGWLMTLIFLFAGAPFWEDWIISARGVPAQGMPQAVTKTGASVGGQRVYDVTFSYTDANGARQTATSGSHDQGIISRAESREPLPIHYVPGSPRLARIDGTKRSFFGIAVFFPFLFAAIGTGVVVFTIRGILKRRRLYVWGQTTTGRVVTVSDSGTRVNGRMLLRIRYQFNGPMGPLEGTFDNYEAPPEGTEVTVLFDPNDPDRNVLPLPGSFDS